MNIFNRLFKIGQAEAHSAVDKLENPIKLTEQGIRDLKQQLDKSLQSLAEINLSSKAYLFFQIYLMLIGIYFRLLNPTIK